MTVDSRTLDRSQLQAKVLPELQQIAESLGVTSHQRLKKGDLIDAIIAKMPTDGQDTAASGNGEPKTMERRREEQVGEEGQQASAETARPDGGVSSPDGTASARTEDRPRGESVGTAVEERPSGPGSGERPRRMSREERRRDRDRRREREREEREEELANAPVRSGILDVLPEGYGFLRTSGYLPGNADVYVSLSQIRRFGLRRGDQITGAVRPPRDNEKYPALLRIDQADRRVVLPHAKRRVEVLRHRAHVPDRCVLRLVAPGLDRDARERRQHRTPVYCVEVHLGIAVADRGPRTGAGQ